MYITIHTLPLLLSTVTLNYYRPPANLPLTNNSQHQKVQIITAMGFIAGVAAVECAWVMLLFIIGITPVVHHFWSYDPHPAHPKNSDSLKGDGHLSNEYVRTFPNTFDGEFVQFWKNVCVAGGLAVFLAYQEG